MDPNGTFVYSSKPPGNVRKLLVRLSLLLVVVLFVSGGIVSLLHFTAKFAITSISPNPNSVTTQTISMAIRFSHPLAQNSVSIESNPSIITGSSVAGSTLTVTFAKKTLSDANAYTIDLKSIRSTQGKQLTDQKITFTPTFAPPHTTGEQALLSGGLSSDQVKSINASIAEFKPWAQQVAVDQSSPINYYPDNPDDLSGLWDVRFLVKIDGTTYTAIGSFYDTVHLQLKLFDSLTNKQIFVSGTPGIRQYY